MTQQALGTGKRSRIAQFINRNRPDSCEITVYMSTYRTAGGTHLKDEYVVGLAMTFSDKRGFKDLEI
jgi:hypothetical protein